MGAINYPIPTIVNIAYCSAVFAFRDIEKFRAYRGGTNAPDIYLPYKLVMEADLLDFRNTHFPNDTELNIQANYVLGLCGNYLNESLGALGNAGGIVVNPTTGNPVNVADFRYDFTIGDAGALMNDGDTSLTIQLSGVWLAHFEASGTDMTYDDPTQASMVGKPIYGGTFVKYNLNQPVRTGERYSAWGARITAGTIAGGGGGGVQLPIPYKRGQYLTNDGTELLWDSPNITYTSADFESDGITVIDSRLAIHDFELNLENPNVYLVAGTDYITIDGGGFQILLSEFDATINDYTLTAKMKGAT